MLVHKYKSMPDLYSDGDEATTHDELQRLLVGKAHGAESVHQRGHVLWPRQAQQRGRAREHQS
eukprot:6567514-Pyramimonas_sp.AAC.1